MGMDSISIKLYMASNVLVKKQIRYLDPSDSVGNVQSEF
jgi:hypothetical protein